MIKKILNWFLRDETLKEKFYRRAFQRANRPLVRGWYDKDFGGL